LEIAHKKLREHEDWSLWIGFALNKNPPVWSAHAWNLTPRGYLIEPNARPGEVQLYYGIEVAAGRKELARKGWSLEEIRKFDAYTRGFATEERKREKTSSGLRTREPSRSRETYSDLGRNKTWLKEGCSICQWDFGR
jgi:hypothetical protein